LQVNDPRVLSLLINEINKIDIKSIDMGDFYEHLLAVLGTQKEAGQFRTPRHLIKFIVDVVDPQVGERVLDPACGTAGFLTASFIHIRDTNTSKEAKEACRNAMKMSSLHNIEMSA
jgi:type I restriction enzyme M protein